MEPKEQIALELLSGLNHEKGYVLARMFRHTRMSYKYFWFLGLLESAITSKNNTIPAKQVLQEMAVCAWHPVCFYRLSLGVGDALEEKVRSFQSTSGLEAKSPRLAILSYLSCSQWATKQLQDCVDYVPTRLLQAHFQNQLAGMPDQRKDAYTRKLAEESQKTSSPSMYWLRPSPSGDVVEFNEDWFNFIVANSSILRAFAEYQLCQYLQFKNPNIPGVVNKLQAPITRKLESARRYWTNVQAAFKKSDRPDWFVDIYTSQSLTGRFGIDHFLPWSFVAHDLLWNLTPVSAATNSTKCDRLPQLEKHLPRLAVLHHRALRIMNLDNKRMASDQLTPYAECFNMDASNVLKLSEGEFIAKYSQIMEPQERIARCQGFSIFS
jgi:hypothetical protein